MSLPTLQQIQRQMQAFVLHGDDAVSDNIDNGIIASTERRLRVYAEGYGLRLVEILGNDFPALKACAGAPLFEKWATDYLADHPSRHFSVRYAGNAFAAWLADQNDAHRTMAELATFEWTQSEVFDAADTDVVVFGDLACVAPEQWQTMQLQIQPAARWLSLHSNAPACVVAHNNGEPIPEAAVSEMPSTWLLWRRSLDVHWRSLPPDEVVALNAARAGDDFSAICESLRPWHDEASVAMRAASLLKLWISDELIAAIRFDDQPV